MKETSLNYNCRKATLRDDVSDIAKYIHLTDPHIYPAICPDSSDADWIDLIEQCLPQPDNIFSIDHLSIVEYRGQIVGIGCVIPCGKHFSFTEQIQIPQSLRGGIAATKDKYFDLLVKDAIKLDGYMITNICVDEAHRSRGAGSRLMEHCVRTYGSEPMYLDVIASNDHAVRLYQKYGFQITSEYPGFSLTTDYLQCYHMVRG